MIILIANQNGKEESFFNVWADKTAAMFTGLIITDVFGPFGVPFYNSVISTFLYQLVKLNKESIVNCAIEIIEGKNKKGKIPKYWDGKTAARIVKVLDDWFDKRERTPVRNTLKIKVYYDNGEIKY